jgi:hypothetical protein
MHSKPRKRRLEKNLHSRDSREERDIASLRDDKVRYRTTNGGTERELDESNPSGISPGV